MVEGGATFSVKIGLAREGKKKERTSSPDHRRWTSNVLVLQGQQEQEKRAFAKGKTPGGPLNGGKGEPRSWGIPFEGADMGDVIHCFK